MLILLFGEDTYRSKSKLKEIVEHYKETHQGGMSFKNFNASEIDYQDFKDQFRQASMFTEKKLAEVRGAFQEKDFRKHFLKDKKQWQKSEDTIVLFEEKVKKSDALFKFIKKNCEWEQFELLEGKELKDWTTKQFSEYEVEVSKEALSKLIEFVGSDLWRLSNEVEKLANYKKGGQVSPEDVKLLVKPDLETDIFDTIDAFALKNNQKSLSLIQEHLDQGDSPLYILGMINYQLRNLLIVKNLYQQGKPPSAIKKETDLHSYVVKKTLDQSKKFSLQEIKKIYHQLLEVDLNIKTGKVDKKPALKSFVAEI